MYDGNATRRIKEGKKAGKEGEREGGKKEGTEILEEKLIKNSPKLVTDIRPKTQEAQRTPRRINTQSISY